MKNLKQSVIDNLDREEDVLNDYWFAEMRKLPEKVGDMIENRRNAVSRAICRIKRLPETATAEEIYETSLDDRSDYPAYIVYKTLIHCGSRI